MKTNPARAAWLFVALFLTGFCRGDDQAKTAAQILTAGEEATQKLARGEGGAGLVDGLNQGNLQEAFRLLSSEYIKKEELDYLTLNRSALQGLLERLGPGAGLLTEAGRSARTSPFAYHSAGIGGQVGYVRFGKFTKEEVAACDATLAVFRKDEAIKTVILDLRSPQDQADFAAAAMLLSRFRPPGELLFKIRRPGNDRPDLFISESSDIFWSGETVLLVDGETGGAGEMMALVLRRKQGNLIIGEATRGLNVEFREAVVGKDRILRYAIAEVLLEDGTSIYQKGLTPDLEAATELGEKKAIYAAVDKGEPLEKFLFRQDRPRLNEAALVAGTDPELEYLLARKNGKSSAWDVPLPADRALQMAVDILLSRDFLDSGKRRKKSK